MSESTLDDLIRVITDAYDQGILATNSTSDEVTWNAETSIYFAVTVVTTIGNRPALLKAHGSLQ